MRHAERAERSHPALLAEGFNEVVFASSLYRLEPHLRRLSETQNADIGLDGSDGLGDLLLVRRFFGPDILPLWRWKPSSDVAGGDRVGEIRLGQQYLTLALRTDVDGEGDVGFDVMVPCPFDPECGGYAWAPAYSISCLYRALSGDMDSDADIVCTLQGGFDDVDQEADDHANNQSPRGATPNAFIDLAEEVRDVLARFSVGNMQDASEELDAAVTYLTDALTSPYGDQPSLLAWARTHLRDGIETAS